MSNESNSTSQPPAPTTTTPTSVVSETQSKLFPDDVIKRHRMRNNKLDAPLVQRLRNGLKKAALANINYMQTIHFESNGIPVAISVSDISNQGMGERQSSDKKLQKQKDKAEWP